MQNTDQRQLQQILRTIAMTYLSHEVVSLNYKTTIITIGIIVGIIKNNKTNNNNDKNNNT